MLRLRHARCAAHRRGHGLDARRGARAGSRTGDVQPPLCGGERPTAAGHADVPLAGIRRLGRSGPERAGRIAQGRGLVSRAPGPRHGLGREGREEIRRMTVFTRHHPHWPPGTPKSISIPRTSICYNLEVSARRYPDKTAIAYYGSTVSYAALERDVNALAGYLSQRCGVGRGDRVLLYAQNSPQFIAGYY